jgi:hypothetical protein
VQTAPEIWTAGSKTGVLVASADNGNTNCSPPGGLGQVWVDNTGAIFFMVGTAIQKLAPGASQATTVISGGCINNLPPIWISDFLLDGKDTLYQVGMDVGAKTVVIQKRAPGSTKPTDIATLPLDIFTGDFSTFTMDIKGNIFLADLVDNQLFELRRSSVIDSAYTPGDIGTYYAVVTDIQGYTTVTDTIVINSPTTTVPSISITATATSTPVCTPTSFTANVSNAGLYPNLQWMVSGVKAGGDSSSFSYNLFANGDRVYCILSAQAGCNGPVTDTSNINTQSIDPHGAASVTISTPKDSICQGDTAVFTASVINGSNQPVFQWLLNGDSTGDNSASFIRNNLSSGDVITCLITSDDECGVAKSNSIPLTVSIPPTVESGQIFTILRGHSLQLDPVITGDISNYLWTPASGLSDPTIADPVANPDSNILYTLTLTAPGGCVASATILVNVYTPISIPDAFTHQIPYMLSGSIAMGLYTIPRMTRDIDFIIHLEAKNLDFFVNSFKDGFYCDSDAVRDAIESPLKMFNIIDHTTGYKADFVVLKNDPFRQEEFSRRLKLTYFGKTIYVVSPEDLLISKLIWIQDLQSALQMEDIKNLVVIDNLDWSYILKWINQLKLRTFDLINR